MSEPRTLRIETTRTREALLRERDDLLAARRAADDRVSAAINQEKAIGRKLDALNRELAEMSHAQKDVLARAFMTAANEMLPVEEWNRIYAAARVGAGMT